MPNRDRTVPDHPEYLATVIGFQIRGLLDFDRSTVNGIFRLRFQVQVDFIEMEDEDHLFSNYLNRMELLPGRK